MTKSNLKNSLKNFLKKTSPKIIFSFCPPPPPESKFLATPVLAKHMLF